MKDVRDLVVVGAGFAGLACAKRAAERGLSVLVIERQPSPGRYVHTTGILVKEAQQEWAAPSQLVRKLQRIRLYTPKLRHLDLTHEGYYFLATDTAKLLRYLADEVQLAGVEIRFSGEFDQLTRTKDLILLNDHGVETRFLVGADGVNSKVAQVARLDRNTRLLKGVEWAYEPIDGIDDCLHCFIDPILAPGYIGWVVPGVGVTQVGIAVHQHLKADLQGFVDKIGGCFELKDRRVLNKLGGMIPINGILKRFHDDRVMLIGDAAGMVSPLTAGGIHKAYQIGKIAGDAIADYIHDPTVIPGQMVAATYTNAKWKHAARWCFDNLPVGSLMEVGLRTGAIYKWLARKVFFDRYMDDSD